MEVSGDGVVLFDGVCNVCNGFVHFLVDRDPNAKLLYASQQSEVGQKFMKDRNIETNLETMAFVQGDQIYFHSTAFIRSVALLGGIWSLILVFLVIPAFIRDFCYATFAKYRYKIFGKKDEACRRMTSDLKRRFLQFNPRALEIFEGKQTGNKNN